MFQVVMTKETEGSLNNQLILNDLKLVHPATAWKMKQLFRYLRTFEKIQVRLSRFMGAINPKKIRRQIQNFFSTNPKKLRQQIQKKNVKKSKKFRQQIQKIFDESKKKLSTNPKKIVNKSKKSQFCFQKIQKMSSKIKQKIANVHLSLLWPACNFFHFDRPVKSYLLRLK